MAIRLVPNPEGSVLNALPDEEGVRVMTEIEHECLQLRLQVTHYRETYKVIEAKLQPLIEEVTALKGRNVSLRFYCERIVKILGATS